MTQVDEPTVVDQAQHADVLPILPLKDTVVFPDSMTPLAIGQERSVRLVDDAVANDRAIALVATKDPEIENPGATDVHEVGTAAVIHKMIRVPDGTLRILVQGVRRIRLDEITQEDPFLEARFTDLPDVVTESKELEALTHNVETLFARIVELVPYLPDELQLAVANV
ncbi:MAG: LON peptidase substrate-binding domain-containing protein, partial [Actinomycetota bacterium]|nr:LON peptidase substrate-binding domain-containing protein [Actinomycetota bacterium]